jgi:hypothetical protein
LTRFVHLKRVGSLARATGVSADVLLAMDAEQVDGLLAAMDAMGGGEE